MRYAYAVGLLMHYAEVATTRKAMRSYQPLTTGSSPTYHKFTIPFVTGEVKR